MNKPDSLRRLLIATVPGLKDNPERLEIHVDGGRVVGGGGRTLSFEYRYTLNLVVQEFTGSTDDIAVPVLAWLAEHQPDLLNRAGAEPFTFEMDLLDDDTRDVSINLDLTEVVIVRPNPAGGFTVQHPDASAAPPLDAFEGVPCGAKLWQLFLRDELVAQTSDPAFKP